MVEDESVQQAGFGGGCHWCTEAVFASLKGVEKVQQGWIASKLPHDNFSEAVLVHYKPAVINLELLIDIHIATHSAGTKHNLRHKYRSAIYCTNKAQLQLAEEILNELNASSGQKLVTMVLPFVSFKENVEDYLNYYYSNPDKPFCQVYIKPKIELLKQQYSGWLK